jgi:membrane protease YdiL (CAAX protease family)
MTPDGTTRFLEHAARGRNSPWRYLVGFPFGLLLSVLLTLLTALALWVLPGVEVDVIASLTDTRRPVAFFLANGVLFGLFLAGFWLAARIVQGKRFGDVAGDGRWRLFASGALIWSGVLVAATLIDYAIAPTGFHATASDQTAGLALAALTGLAFQTFAEEFIFRGYVTQGLLLALKRPLPTALVSGVLFGLVHIPNGTPQAVSATVFGVVLALIAIRTGGVAFTFGLHLANNLFGAAVVVSANDAFKGAPGLFTQNTPHLMWWDVAVSSLALVLLAWALPRLGIGQTRTSSDAA